MRERFSSENGNINRTLHTIPFLTRNQSAMTGYRISRVVLMWPFPVNIYFSRARVARRVQVDKHHDVNFYACSPATQIYLSMLLEELRENRRIAERNRGLVACFECRKYGPLTSYSAFSVCFPSHRAKRKCDKKMPCSSCISRGLDHICPNGEF